jgi:hypothetical protein
MSSFIDILKKAFPFLEKENRRALFLGLDSSGRTTALYRVCPLQPVTAADIVLTMDIEKL